MFLNLMARMHFRLCCLVKKVVCLAESKINWPIYPLCPTMAISFGQIVPTIGQSSIEKSNHGKNVENRRVKIVRTFDIHRMIMEWSSDIIIGGWCEGDAHVTFELEGSLLIEKNVTLETKATNLIMRWNTLGISLLATLVCSSTLYFCHAFGS